MSAEGPPAPAELERFVSTFLYGPEAFFIDEITRMDRRHGERRSSCTGRRPASAPAPGAW